jgi:hypothetical protein
MTQLRDQIDEADRTHDIRDVLGLTTNRRTIVCPLPQHQHVRGTPSFSIYWKNGKQWWKCHGNCQLEGDLVDLVGYMRVSGYERRDPAKVRKALELVDQRYAYKIVTPPPIVTLDGNEWRKYPLGKEVIAYGARRGLTQDTLKRFRIGQGDLWGAKWMTIPSFTVGMLRGIKLRNIGRCTPDFRYASIEGGTQSLFNFDKIRYHTGPVFVVKAEIPCMLMDQVGFYACAPTGGEGSRGDGGWFEEWRTALALAKTIVVGDNDASGKKLGERRAALFAADLKFPPENWKDIDEWILADPAAINTIKSWTEEK